MPSDLKTMSLSFTMTEEEESQHGLIYLDVNGHRTKSEVRGVV